MHLRLLLAFPFLLLWLLLLHRCEAQDYGFEEFSSEQHRVEETSSTFFFEEGTPGVEDATSGQQGNVGDAAASAQQVKVPRPGFYDQSCPAAEAIVRRTMVSYFDKNPLLAAGVLRLFFHDCFVQGCDGSVLLDTVPGGPLAEKNSQVNNNSITGFRVIDSAKKKLETVCPGIVSCSDVLALAARDAVWISGGPFWQVPTGRLDGRVSNATEADDEIPPSDLNVTELRTVFQKKGLNTHDLVTLSGAHTIGRAHCFVFEDRLYNFTNTSLPDPTLNVEYLQRLQRVCPQNSSKPLTVNLDRQTQVLFDNSYYQRLLESNGLLQSDQELLFDAATMGLVRIYASNVDAFFRRFTRSMVKLSRVGLKQPGEGEIRKHCRRVNS